MPRSTKILLIAGLLVEALLFWGVSFVSQAQIIPSLNDAAEFTNTVNIVNLLIATLAGMSVLTGFAGYRILIKAHEERTAESKARERKELRDIEERDKERATLEKLAGLMVQSITALTTSANNTDAGRRVLESTANLVSSLVDSALLNIKAKQEEVGILETDRDRILAAYRQDLDSLLPVLTDLQDLLKQFPNLNSGTMPTKANKEL
jgi:uncharacterized membrane protein YqhA